MYTVLFLKSVAGSVAQCSCKKETRFSLFCSDMRNCRKETVSFWVVVRVLVRQLPPLPLLILSPSLMLKMVYLKHKTKNEENVYQYKSKEIRGRVWSRMCQIDVATVKGRKRPLAATCHRAVFTSLVPRRRCGGDALQRRFVRHRHTRVRCRRMRYLYNKTKKRVGR